MSNRISNAARARTLAAPALGLVAAAVFAGAAGCRHDRVAPPMGRPDTVTDETYPNVVIEQPLQRFVAVPYGDIRVQGATASAPMQVAVPLRSTGDRQMAVQYRFLWFNESGMQIGDSGWKFAAMEPGTQIRAQANALTTEAAAWRLEVRSGR